jgi:hypothetical protein
VQVGETLWCAVIRSVESGDQPRGVVLGWLGVLPAMCRNARAGWWTSSWTERSALRRGSRWQR